MAPSSERTKICSKCQKEQTLNSFYGKGLVCKACYSLLYKIKWKEQRRRFLETEFGKSREQERSERNCQRYKELRKNFFAMYGTSCACCGDSREMALSIDHVIPVSNRIKNSLTGIPEIRKALKKYRPDLYQTLCMNCNMNKGKKVTCGCNTTVMIVSKTVL